MTEFLASLMHNARRRIVMRTVVATSVVVALASCFRQVKRLEAKPSGDRFMTDAGLADGGSCPPDMVRMPTAVARLGIGTTLLNPARMVSIPTFCIDRTEETFGTYVATMSGVEGTPPCRADAANHPAQCTYAEARRFCEARGRRLLTADEWEYAARGTDARPYPWGNEPPRTPLGVPTESIRPVASTPQDVSSFGVYDLADNVEEWVDGAGKCLAAGSPTAMTRGIHASPATRFSCRLEYDMIAVGVRCAK